MPSVWAINVSPCFAKDVYPDKKVMFIVPHRAGGGYDIYARGIAPYISKYLKTIPGAISGDIVVRNEPAAADRKGYSLLFNAKADGYTIGVTDTAQITDNIVGEAEFDFTKLTFLILGSSGTKYIVAN